MELFKTGPGIIHIHFDRLTAIPALMMLDDRQREKLQGYDPGFPYTAIDCRFDGQRGLDMGSGTGVLAMLAVLRGAERMDAVDIDDWAYRNASENIADNGMADRIRPLLGDRRAIEGKRYDFILANINRNVLLADMDAYAAALHSGDMLFLSGILGTDVDAVTDRAQQFGFERLRTRTRSGWAVVRFKKK